MAWLCLAAAASAVCVQNSASQADIDHWNTFGCWEEYFLWQYCAYDVRSGDWSNRVWNDACNRNVEYPKHWAATVLLEYDLLDNNDQSFHFVPRIAPPRSSNGPCLMWTHGWIARRCLTVPGGDSGESAH
jgi:hypothetical protein